MSAGSGEEISAGEHPRPVSSPEANVFRQATSIKWPAPPQRTPTTPPWTMPCIRFRPKVDVCWATVILGAAYSG